VDSSQSQDPFRGEGHGEIAEPGQEESMVPQFNEDRWRRVGATDEQVTALRDAWDAYTDDQKATTDEWMHQTSDPELLAWLNQEQKVEEPQQPVQTAEPATGATSTEQPGSETPQGDGQGDGQGQAEGEQTAGTAETPQAVPPAEGQQPVGAGGDPTQANVSGQIQTAEPTAYTADDVPDLPNAKAVEDWVGDDKAKAQAALDKEKAGENRKGLTAHLERIVGA